MDSMFTWRHPRNPAARLEVTASQTPGSCLLTLGHGRMGTVVEVPVDVLAQAVLTAYMAEDAPGG